MTTTPAILISRPAARMIFDEVRRWVEAGLERGGSPLESLMYPLSALVPARGAKTPRTPLELVVADEIGELVIDEVAIPSDDVKSFSAANCHFAARDMGAANEAFNLAIDEAIMRRPRLSVSSKLHSHPFAGGAFLSSGDLYHGVTSAKAVKWRERQGLGTSILHVAYPDHDPVPGGPWRLFAEGAICGRGSRACTWRIRSWLSREGQMLDAGDAKIVSTFHRSVRAARRRPYWRTIRGARWCDGQKRQLRAAGFGTSRNLLGRGWRRYLVQSRERQLLFALPPDFPALAPRVLEIRRAWYNDFEPLPLPRGWSAGSYRCSLLELARHYGSPLAPAQTGQP